MYCPKCHKAMDPELPTCKYCGFLNKEYDYNKDRTIKVDCKSGGLNIFSFLIPIIGIILYFANKNEYPKRANSIIKYTFGGIIVYVLIYVLFVFVLK